MTLKTFYVSEKVHVLFLRARRQEIDHHNEKVRKKIGKFLKP